MNKDDSSTSLVNKMLQQNNDKNAFYGNQKLLTPLEKPSERNKIKLADAGNARPTVADLMLESM